MSDALHQHLMWMRLRNLAPTSVAQRRYCLLRLASFLTCEAADLLGVTGCDLDRWQRSLVHLSPRHRSTSAAHVRQFYRWAQQHGHVREDPAVVLVQVRIPRGLPHPIRQDDLSMALACAPERIRPWLMLAAYAGLRAAEIAGLLREHVRDTADPPVLAFTGKGGRDRIVPLSDLVLMELQASGLPSRGFVFGRLDGAPGQNAPGRVSHLCNDYLHGLGITESLHSLRHWFGTALYAESADLRMTQEVMGHSSPATTAGYVQWSHQGAVAAVTAIGRRARPTLAVVTSDDVTPWIAS